MEGLVSVFMMMSLTSTQDTCMYAINQTYFVAHPQQGPVLTDQYQSTRTD